MATAKRVHKKQSIRQLALYILGAIVASATFIFALQVRVSAMTIPAHAIDHSTINRTSKGDRLTLVGVATDVIPGIDAVQPPLPEECINASDWHRSRIYTTEIAGRCFG